jgi:hypothetical protein
MAQRTAAGYKTIADSRFADNTTGAIEEIDHRDQHTDAADSFLNKSDDLLDEDNMASNSATKVASQQSIKAYVDNQVFGSGVIDTSSRVLEDFYAAVQYFGLSAFNNGGGLGLSPSISTYGLDATEKALGVLLLSTGTSTAGGSALNNTTWNLTFGHGYTITQTWRAALKDLSDATDTFTVEIGFGNAFSSSPTVGAFFRYTHSVNAGKWQAVTVVAGVETAADTTITAAVDGFHTFKIVANSTATQVDFYIDGTLRNSITTNIPNGSGGAETMGYNAVIRKTAGSTAKGLYVDYFDLTATRTAAR